MKKYIAFVCVAVLALFMFGVVSAEEGGASSDVVVKGTLKIKIDSERAKCDIT